ncbi:Ig-like domain-containing protein [Pyxidicoccus sp. MSG2]|uniref:Ig-like domain-containing protein n=1 Tax=Pyxidicoccus sp. MSG2 TaxID=2996790 RepID=UPI002270A2E0|nr:Ig-like domain-containing protein [Pyxidicoccus sp. MSG2]MCY1018490.1 hypothetical protein [Pyxidicoccus sp. MSG2]
MHATRSRPWKSVLLCTALGLAACDSLKAEPDPGPPVKEESPPPPELRVTVTPAGPARCREGTWTLSVSVEGGTPEKVELIANGLAPTTLDSPYRHTVDCATAEEGSYFFIARATAEGRTFESQSVSMVVDRQGPFVESWGPASYYPSVDAPLEIVFSEPLLPASLQSAPTVLRDGNGFSVAHTAVLSGDGRVLRLTPTVPLRVPGTLRAELVQRNMTDLVGNPFTLERSVVEKRFDYWPFAQAAPRMSDTSKGWLRFALQPFPSRPVVAFIEQGSDDSADKVVLGVEVMNGDSWERLPSPRAPVALADAPANLQLEVHFGSMVLAWVERTSFQDMIHVSRFDGTSWKDLGAPLATGAPYGTYQMALDEEGDPVVVYQEKQEDGLDLRVVRWAGNDWQLLGGTLSANPKPWTVAGHPAIAVDSSRVVVAWAEKPPEGESSSEVFVMEFKDGGWRQLGSSLSGVPGGWGAGQVAIALRGYEDSPVVAWTESASFSYDGYVFTAYWKPSPFAGIPGSWTRPEELQGATQYAFLDNLRLLMDSTNEPWVVWQRKDGDDLITYYRKHRPTGWEPEQLVVGTEVFGFRLDENSFPWVLAGYSPQDAILRPQ